MKTKETLSNKQEEQIVLEKSTKEQATAWWNNLDEDTQWEMYEKYLPKKKLDSGEIVIDSTAFGDNKIEEIWRKETNCSNCNQTRQNCECHISDINKHKGLSDLTKQFHTSSFIPRKQHQKLPVICVNCKEIYDNPVIVCNCGGKTFESTHSSNAKQFKEFNVILFKKYIDKFSEEQKFNMFLVLLKDFKLESSIESNIMTLVALRNI